MKKYKKYKNLRENWDTTECSTDSNQHPSRITNDCLILSQGRPLYKIDLDYKYVPSSLTMKYNPYYCGEKEDEDTCSGSSTSRAFCKWDSKYLPGKCSNNTNKQCSKNTECDAGGTCHTGKCLIKTGNISEDVFNMYKNNSQPVNNWVRVQNTIKGLDTDKLVGKTYVGPKCGTNTPGYPASFITCEKGKGDTTKVHFVPKCDGISAYGTLEGCDTPAESGSKEAAIQYQNYFEDINDNNKNLNKSYVQKESITGAGPQKSIFDAEYKYLIEWNDAQWAAFLIWRWDTDLEAYLHHLESIDDDIQQNIFATEIWDPAWRKEVRKKHSEEIVEYQELLEDNLKSIDLTISSLEATCEKTDGVYHNCNADGDSLQDLYDKKDFIINELNNNPSKLISQFDPRLSWRVLYRDKQGYTDKAGFIKNRGWVHKVLRSYHSMLGSRGKTNTNLDADYEGDKSWDILSERTPHPEANEPNPHSHSNIREQYGPSFQDGQAKWADNRPVGYDKFFDGSTDTSRFMGNPYYKDHGLSEFPGIERSNPDLRRTSDRDDPKEAQKFELCRIHPFDRYSHIDDKQFELLHYGITKTAWLTMLYETGKQKRREAMVQSAYINSDFKETQDFTTCKRKLWIQKVDQVTKVVQTLYDIVHKFTSIAKFLESFGKALTEIGKDKPPDEAVDDLTTQIDERIEASQPVSGYWEQFAADRDKSKAEWGKYKGVYDSYTNSVQVGADANAKIAATRFQLASLLPENENVYKRPNILQFYFNHYLPSVIQECECPETKLRDCGLAGKCTKAGAGCAKKDDPCCWTHENQNYCIQELLANGGEVHHEPRHNPRPLAKRKAIPSLSLN
jgi:hypothetical protein